MSHKLKNTEWRGGGGERGQDARPETDPVTEQLRSSIRLDGAAEYGKPLPVGEFVMRRLCWEAGRDRAGGCIAKVHLLKFKNKPLSSRHLLF